MGEHNGIPIKISHTVSYWHSVPDFQRNIIEFHSSSLTNPFFSAHESSLVVPKISSGSILLAIQSIASSSKVERIIDSINPLFCCAVVLILCSLVIHRLVSTPR